MANNYQIDSLLEHTDDYISYSAINTIDGSVCEIRRYSLDTKYPLTKVKKWQTKFNDILKHFASRDIPTLVNIIDGGYDPVDGFPFLVFEGFSRSVLSGVIDAGQKIDPNQVSHLVKNTLRGLEHLHGMDLVHGNLTPKSILYTGEESKDTWVLDWDPVISLTTVQSNRAVSRNNYTAPELSTRKKPNASSDLFSLGKILLEVSNHKPNMEQWLQSMIAPAASRFNSVDEARHALLGQAYSPPSKHSVPITRMLKPFIRKGP